MSTPLHDPRWKMRWFILVTFSILLIGSLAGSFILIYQTKNPIPLVVPTPLLFAIRPIIRFLFREENTLDHGKDTNMQGK